MCQIFGDCRLFFVKTVKMRNDETILEFMNLNKKL